MCLWCGKGIKNYSLPSLHQECVPPDFGFPVRFESGKTKKKVYRIHMTYTCIISYSMADMKRANIMEVDHSKLKTLWVKEMV